ncbi:hypothetical protein SAMN05421780_103211 [Flexibacter flexilis DSM 6793]|uniref:Uncharacterized protein n=1 Tax=Flexibacter flexilis DSM 6793 TaxID=927664 RepID=A0A1I1HCW4_9BACT|nr:hypothetical protein SAMN05421780_103211 [Flexibacter flexilis DSM 6793]
MTHLIYSMGKKKYVMTHLIYSMGKKKYVMTHLIYSMGKKNYVMTHLIYSIGKKKYAMTHLIYSMGKKEYAFRIVCRYARAVRILLYGHKKKHPQTWLLVGVEELVYSSLSSGGSVSRICTRIILLFDFFKTTNS